MKKVAVSMFILSVLLVANIAAQEVTASIVGTVTDSTGAVVPNAKVTVTNTATFVERTYTTGDDGGYVATLLPIGTYKVSVTAQGFKTASRTGITLNVNDKAAHNFVLEVGNVAEVVIVEASAVQVDTQTVVAAGLISGQEVREIALNSRNFTQLVSLMPGVTSDAAGDQVYFGVNNPLTGLSNTVRFSINGTRNSSNNWTIDGADNVDRGANLTLLNYPSVDAIAEFKVLRGLYSAEFGRSSSGQVNIITKSGGSRYHGDVYEFFRNDVLAANNFFNNRSRIARPPLRYNNFGYTFSGPVLGLGKPGRERHKAFFFWSQEFRRTINPTTVQATVPTAAEKQGNFPQPICILVTGTTCAQTATSIPQAQWNPVAAAYIRDIWSKIPDGDANHTLFWVARNVSNYRQDLIKVDYQFTPSHALSVRFINDSIPTEEPRGLFTGAGLPGVSNTATNSPGKGWVVRATNTIRPSVVNEAGWAFSYGAIVSKPTGLGASANSPNIKPTLPFPVTLGRVPSLAAGFSSIAGFGPYDDFNRNHNIFDNLIHQRGSHTLKFGFSLNLYQKTENAGGNNVGSFSFSTTPRPTGTSTFLQQWAFFLLGQTSSFTQNSLDLFPDIRAKNFEWYVQDDYRISRNLTLNIGLRHSLFRQPYDAKGFLTNFDPRAFDPSKAPEVNAAGSLLLPFPADAPGIIINNKNSPYGSKVANEVLNAFAPRIGLAWDPFGDGKTSIRTGYGLAYDLTAYGPFETNIFNNPPFVNSVSIPNTRLDNPAAGTPSISLAPKAIRGVPIENDLPYVQQWSFDVQREIRSGFLLDVGYYGSRGTHLLNGNDLNTIPVGLAQSSGVIPAGTNVTSANVARLNALRPYRGYTSISALRNWSSSIYNSLQVSSIIRWGGSSSVRLSYTWSRSITDATADTTAPQDNYNRRLERGLSSFDRKQVLTINYIYQIPFLREQKGLVGQVFGGWQISGIAAFNSGLPLSLGSGQGIDWAQQGGATLSTSPSAARPDMISNPNTNAPHTLTKWFNTEAFADVPAGVIRPGNAPRYFIRGPGYQRWDLSVFKSFRMTERFKLTFRSEFFNLFNHTNLQGVGSSYATGSTTFGVVTSTRDARVVQLAMKLYF